MIREYNIKTDNTGRAVYVIIHMKKILMFTIAKINFSR